MCSLKFSAKTTAGFAPAVVNFLTSPYYCINIQKPFNFDAFVIRFPARACLSDAESNQLCATAPLTAFSLEC